MIASCTAYMDEAFALETFMDQAHTLRNQSDLNAGTASRLRVISVASGKGGVGKTFCAVNLAVLAAKRGQRVLLLDADLGLANVEIVLGIRPRYNISDLLEKNISIHEVLASGPFGIRVLAGGSGFCRLTQLADEEKQTLVHALEPLDDTFDLVLIDSGAGIGENVLFFASASQENILVLNHEPTALSDAYATIKVLSKEAGVKDFQILVNDVPSELEARKVFGALTTVTERFLEARLHYLGSIPTDPAVSQAILQQIPAVECFPQSAASHSLGQISEALFTNPPKESDLGGLKFLWHRLLRERS
jgi:flagellar biosynthesis protein FlhG